jgi:inhibitor of cysteine peptidase
MRALRPFGVPLLRSSLVLACLSLAAGCGGSTPGDGSPSPPATLHIGPDAAGTTVTLAPGDRLVIELPANPSTGFAWTVAFGPDPAVLVPVGEPEVVVSPLPSGVQTIIGAGGTALLRFVAVAAGSTELTLVYERPWERAPADRFAIAVDVG